MIILLTIVHVIVCAFLILVVLLQQGKSADIASTFGGAGSQTVFGARGAATALTKATTISAVLFMITSLFLTILVSRPGSSSVIREGAQAPVQQPATPAPAVPAPSSGDAAQPGAVPQAPAPDRK